MYFFSGEKEMPFEFDWLVPQNVSICRFYDNITVEELIESNKKGLEFGKLVPAPSYYHSVIDAIDAKRFPLSIKLLNTSAASSYRQLPNVGWVVIVSTNSVVQMLGATVLRMTRNRYITVRSMDQAIAHLRKQDSTIRWETATSKFAEK
jgi:hypothetical protein